MAANVNFYSQIAASAGTAGLFGLTLVPQTLRLGTYKEILGNYKDGQLTPVSDGVNTIIEKVLARMRLAPEDEANLEVFTCYGNDPVHKGSVNFRTGGILGVPATFYYKSKDDIDQEKLRAGGRIIDWDSDAGQRLADSMMLSEKAKAFAIAREINYLSTYHLYSDGLLKALFATVAYGGCYTMNRRYLIREKLKLYARGSIYSVYGGLAYMMYTIVADAYFCRRDNTVDKKTAKLGWAYAEGGQEFYTKTLHRNMALRELMGPSGAKTFTVYGNNVVKVRRPNVELTERRKAMEKYYKEYVNREKEELEGGGNS